MSEYAYFFRYGYEGTTGRYNSPSLRGNFNNELSRHTAKGETRSWVTPTPTPSVSVTPSISVTPSVTPTISVTPSVSISVTPTPTVSPV